MPPSFSPSPASSRPADSLDHKSRSDRNPAGRLIASLRAIRWSLLTSHPFKKKFRVNPVKSEPDWQKSELTTQAVVTAVEPSQLLIFSELFLSKA